MPLLNCSSPNKPSDQTSRPVCGGALATHELASGFFRKCNLFTPISPEAVTWRFLTIISLIKDDMKANNSLQRLPVALSQRSRSLLRQAESEFEQEKRSKGVEYGDLQAGRVGTGEATADPFSAALKGLKLFDFPCTLKDTFLILNVLKRQGVLDQDTLRGVFDAFGRQGILHARFKKNAIKAKKAAIDANGEKPSSPMSEADKPKVATSRSCLRENTLLKNVVAPTNTLTTFVESHSLEDIENMLTLDKFAIGMGEFANECAESCSDDLLQVTIEALARIALNRFGTMFDQAMKVCYRSLKDPAREALASKALLPIKEGRGGFEMVDAKSQGRGLIRLVKYDDKALRKQASTPPIKIPGYHPKLMAKNYNMRANTNVARTNVARTNVAKTSVLKTNAAQLSSSPKAPFKFSPT